MDTVVQRLLSKSEYRHISAWVSHPLPSADLGHDLITKWPQNEFCLLLLPLLSRKVKKTVPTLLTRPSLFAHTIYQALIFDSALTEEGFKLEKTTASTEKDETWKGISEEILGNPLWFNAWLQAEKKCAYYIISLCSWSFSTFPQKSTTKPLTHFHT